ncbi:MAG: hypothetical protein GX039_08240 [Clostridia bacterium]|nr:hypothetical protein [Clostridia bacterium]
MDPSLHFLTREHWQWNLLFFIYGLSFFLMGFAILILTRRGSKLHLSRSLPWLAAFGLAHGLVEWGYILIPTAVVAEGWETLGAIIFNGGHALLLPLSYTFLLAFGLNLLVDTRGWSRRLKSLPVLAFIIWFLIFFFTFPGRGPAINNWLLLGDIMARYILALPGSILSAVAILNQQEELASLGRRSLRHYLLGSAAVLFLYAVAGGLLVPPAPFFPASVINTGLLMYLGLPVPVLRISSSLLLTYFIFRLLEVFEAEEQKYHQVVREREMIWREREKIRRDLHDGVIQAIYGLALGLEYTRGLLAENPSAAAGRLQALSQQAEAVIEDLRGYLAGLHLGRELPPEPVAIIKQRAADLLQDSGLEIFWHVQGEKPGTLDSDQRDHLYHMVTEIFSNIRRHARASRVRIQVEQEVDGFMVSIKDDGTGILRAASYGQGLGNLRQRAALAGGWVEIADWPGRGTTVTFWLPYYTGDGGKG